MIRKVVMEVCQGQPGKGPGQPPPKAPSPAWKTLDAKSGIASFRAREVRPEPFDTGRPGDRVFLKDMVDLPESPRLGFGIMEMDRSSFPWTLNYDEVDYVIQGSLEIVIDGRTIKAGTGEVVFIPAGSSIEFKAPGFCRFFYVVYPANWWEQ
jgi:ethanolamine utilization protein EutQ